MRTTYLRFLQLATGVLVAVFLGIHIVLQHLDTILGFLGVNVAESTSWTSMIDRASQGIWVFIYIALLATGIYHGIHGLRGIIIESTSSVKAERIITWFLIVLGIVAFAWGTYVPIALFSS